MISHELIRYGARAFAKTLLVCNTTAFSRASVAYQSDASGQYNQVAANVLRNAHYVNGVLQPPLIEAAATNRVLWSRDLTNALWLGAAQPVNDITGLDGTPNGGTTITDSSAVAFQEKHQSYTIPNDSNNYSVRWWVKKDADQTRFPLFAVNLVGGTGQGRRCSLNTQTGAFALVNIVGAGGGSVQDLGNAWLVDVYVTNNNSGNNALTITTYVAGKRTLTGTDDATTTGSLGILQIQGDSVPSTVGSSPIFTTTTAVTRAADIDQMFAATSQGYTRQIGSFVTEGFAVGMELTATSFARSGNNGTKVITAVAPTLLSVDGLAAEAAVAGRSLSVGFPSMRSWENSKFKPTTGVPYVGEQYLPGPSGQQTLGPNGDLELTPIYLLYVNVSAETGELAAQRYIDKLLTLFAPRTAIALSNGDVLRVRSDMAPYPGQLLPSSESGFSYMLLTVPLRLRTQNSI